MMEENDVQLQMKKRARRRLVGAVALAGLAAVVLPMVMDQEPKQVSQEVEIRIPGQDEKPFVPRLAAPPAESKGEKSSLTVTKESVPSSEKQVESQRLQNEGVSSGSSPAVPQAASTPAAAMASPEKGGGKQEKTVPSEKSPEKTVAKPVESAKNPDKPVEKNADKTPRPDADSQRAAAILAGKAPEGDAAYVILIGAFNSQGNVKLLQTKLAELGLKVYTEPLDTPQGKKTRVRAGPFATREAGEKALEKMKRIGVSGVLAPR